LKKKRLNKLFIVATEQSGDNIGYSVLKELKKHYPYLKIDGIGGELMKPLMRNQFFSLKDFKSIGIVEIIFSIKKYINIINFLAKLIIKNKYDLILTIDSPDFNYPLVNKIRKKGFNKKIFHIVAPTVWAWRQYRAKKFAKVYNHMFTIFNFENSFFEKYKLKSTFVGHPIFYIKKNSNKFKKNLVAFLPGSRLGEIKSLFIYFELAYEKLLDSNYKYHIFIPTLPHLKKEIINRTKKWKLKTIITTKKNEIENYYSKTNIALVCSGTASLEIAKREIPQLIIYKLNYFTELIASFLIKIKYANIVNIIENKMIIPELVNSKLNKRNFKIKFEDLLKNKKSNSKQIIESRKIIRKLIQKKSPYKKIVDVIIKII
tara:strand:- start:671 stop:1792 length:1122 start_codon:yes stop_codon:yes gene_type:complete